VKLGFSSMSPGHSPASGRVLRWRAHAGCAPAPGTAARDRTALAMGPRFDLVSGDDRFRVACESSHVFSPHFNRIGRTP
jgi:hypothetical protein